MRRVALVALTAVLAGCPPGALHRTLRRNTALETGCPEDKVSLPRPPSVMGFAGSWYAVACDRVYDCRLLTDNSTRCTETPDSKAVTIQRVVIDRLSLETACPKDKIRVDKGADWSHGGEEAFRLEACGGWYVCAAPAGKVECKAALASGTAPAGAGSRGGQILPPSAPEAGR